MTIILSLLILVFSILSLHNLIGNKFKRSNEYAIIVVHLTILNIIIHCLLGEWLVACLWIPTVIIWVITANSKHEEN